VEASGRRAAADGRLAGRDRSGRARCLVARTPGARPLSRFDRFLDPPRLRTLDADEERRATWLELFLDLVFVAAIAEVASTLSADPTAVGFGRYLLHGGQNAFVVAYVAVRAVLLVLYARVYRDLEFARPVAGWL